MGLGTSAPVGVEYGQGGGSYLKNPEELRVTLECYYEASVIEIRSK